MSLKTFKNTYSIYLMTTNQIIASGLSYLSDKLFPKNLPGSCHSPEAVMSDSWQPTKQRRSFNLEINAQHSTTSIYLSRIIFHSSLIQNFCFNHCSFIHFSTYMPWSISWLEWSSSPFTPIKLLHVFQGPV